MWGNHSQFMYRTTSQLSNSQIRLTNYSSQTTHRKLKQVFNITFTHYCSTSIHKKLQNKCRESSKKYDKIDFKDCKHNFFSIADSRKIENFIDGPLKLKFVTLKNSQSNLSKYEQDSRDPKNKKTQLKNRYNFPNKIQSQKIYTQQQFPLKATGHKVELQQKQDSKRHSRKTFYRPSSAYSSLLKSKQTKRLKTTYEKCLDQKQSQRDMRLGVKGWELSQRQY